ncbi:ribonuclease HI family protein [Candidatus Gottesmanbacteria bacterium]|nr:ribonuclease HI family protein [Candidatus Gottesmanbacteria bacterium]
MKYVIYTDGGARGNPGPAAIGVVIQNIAEFGRRIGEATNNVAEYTAVREALAYLRNNPIIKLSNNPIIQFYLDSTLVVQQLNGMFKVKDAKLRELLTQIRFLEQEIGGVVTYAYVPREQNRRADLLVNRALDAPPHVSFP